MVEAKISQGRGFRSEIVQNASANFSVLSNTSGVDPVLSKPWSKAKTCLICGKKLGKLQGTQKHHCRFCGETVCSEHSQHTLTHPTTGENVRCCDTCRKSIVGKETRDEVERRMAELKDRIAEERGIMVRKTKEKERLEMAVASTQFDIQGKRTRGAHCLQIYQDRINNEKTDLTRFQSMLSHNKSSLEYSLDVVRSVTRQYAEKKAEFTEIRDEVEGLDADVQRTSRGVIEKIDQLRTRVPTAMVGNLLGKCCEPKYLGVSFNASNGFNASIFKQSLQVSTRNLPRDEGIESCKCSLM